MASADFPQTVISTALARDLHQPADNPYISDLVRVIRNASPVLLDMLHNADGYMELVFEDGQFFMHTEELTKRLLP